MAKQKKGKKKRAGKKKLSRWRWWMFVMIGVVIVVSVFCLRKCLSDTMVSDTTATSESAYQFNDLNPTQLAVAKQLGITPAETRDKLEAQLGKLVKIAVNDNYKVNHLDYSMPYLTPGAAQLLSDIGKEFKNLLRQDGYREYSIIVTSALRSIEDQMKLGKDNVNAAKNSAHCYGTTFDITYTRFYQTGVGGNDIDVKELANVLGATLKELRDAGRCYVKYEENQHCYHITTRK